MPKRDPFNLCYWSVTEMEEMKCRLWWPDRLLASESTEDLLLFGWCVHDSSSMDVIVSAAFTAQEILDRLAPSELQEILCNTIAKLPIPLRDYAALQILGLICINRSKANKRNHFSLSKDARKMHSVGEGQNGTFGQTFSTNRVLQQSHGLSIEAFSSDDYRMPTCCCENLDQYLALYRLSKINCGIWIQLSCIQQCTLQKECIWIPELHHMHLSGHILPISDVHLIMYDPPVHGIHHFSLKQWGFDQVESHVRKPYWVNNLLKKQLLPNMEAIVLALNCSTASKLHLERQLDIQRPPNQLYCLSMLSSILWQAFTIFVASISTVVYSIMHFFYRFLGYWSQSSLTFLSKIFSHTWKNVHIRSCQFIYWPVFLQGCGASSHSNVEFAHGTMLRKHFVWSNVAIDIFLGTIIGVALLANIEAACIQISLAVNDITDNVLRSGCVWLMGVPAGFKLNTELAELFGMVSLNAIQVISTLWMFMASFLKYFIAGVALSGILFGITVPAALCIDMLKLTTLHILALHWAISFLYSMQIKALASLWRLFRGKKWNPLRQRLDSYECTVEQHIVGSLIFTPLLLLLPTASVFYVFFTILSTTLNFICITIEIALSLLHATPYAEIVLWVARRKLFPSGIWFEFTTLSVSFSSLSCGGLPPGLDPKLTGFQNGQTEPLISVLKSNYATIGQVIVPHYRDIFKGISPSLVKSAAYGILFGERMASTLQTSLPPTMPWVNISLRDYWCLCYHSLLSCRSSA